MQKNYAIVLAPDPQTLINVVNAELAHGRRVVGGPLLLPMQVPGPRLHGVKDTVLFAQAVVEDSDDAMREQLAAFVALVPAALEKLGVVPPKPFQVPADEAGGPGVQS